MPFFGKSDRGRGRKGDALVGRSEKLIAFNAGGEQRLRIELAQAAEALAVAEQSRIEKVRCLAPRLGHEFTEAKHFACQREGEKFLAEIGHFVHDNACAASIAAATARDSASRIRRRR